MACNSSATEPGVKGCSGNTGPSGYQRYCTIDWVEVVFGTSDSDAVDYVPPITSVGVVIRDSTYNTLETLVNKERLRRGYGAINRVGGVGTLMESLDWNTLIDGINTTLGEPRYIDAGSTPSPIPNIPTIPITVVGQEITSAVANLIGSTTDGAGNQCLCNCNYCACNCNACVCNCNYGCTCNCNYRYSDETLKIDIEYI